LKNSTSTLIGLGVFLLVIYLFKDSLKSLFSGTALGAGTAQIASFGAPTFLQDGSIAVPGASSNPTANPLGIDWSKLPSGGIIATS
jgi:hypothetical protein